MTPTPTKIGIKVLSESFCRFEISFSVSMYCYYLSYHLRKIIVKKLRYFDSLCCKWLETPCKRVTDDSFIPENHGNQTNERKCEEKDFQAIPFGDFNLICIESIKFFDHAYDGIVRLSLASIV